MAQQNRVKRGKPNCYRPRKGPAKGKKICRKGARPHLRDR